MLLVRLSHWNGLNMQKNSKNFKQYAKIFLKRLKSMAIVLILCIFISLVIYTNSSKILLKKEIGSLHPYLKIIRICCYRNVLKEEKMKHKFWPLTKFLWKRLMSNRQKISYDIISVNTIIFELQGTAWDISRVRICYKLTTRITKIEKFKNILKTYNIKNFKTICYKMTAFSNINHFILNYKFLSPVSILRVYKEEKNRQNHQIQEKMS